MPLYTELERIERGLAASGILPSDPIKVERLFPLDQWHYHGTEAIQSAAELLRLGPESRVLDIGAGIGGPARYLAHTTGCHVTALELQPKLHSIAEDLTRRCGLDGLISHLCGDALSYPFANNYFDAVVSWLAVLHIPDRAQLFKRLARALHSRGSCYIEDLCRRAPFAGEDLRDLQEIVFGMSVTSIDEYAKDLRSAGFVDIVVTDLTDDWARYAADRLTAWRENHGAYARVHGEAAYAAQEGFSALIAHLYDAGSLGGVRLVAQIP